MKRLMITVLSALIALSTVAIDSAEAKRLGGGQSSGMRRQMPSHPNHSAAPEAPTNRPNVAPSPATPMPAPAAPVAVQKRSWLAPVAGLAAGLGLAALMHHFGMGAELGNFLVILLLVGLGFFLLRFFMRRLNPPAPQLASNVNYAQAGSGLGGFQQPRSDSSLSAYTPTQAAPAATASYGSGASQPQPVSNFDYASFERLAKLIFIRMQAANDAGNLEDLRKFSTPEMFATFKLELQDRKRSGQQTDVVQLDAQVLEVAQEGAQQVVSVRFHGLLREENNGPATPFDETWHLLKGPETHGEWVIAGIQQNMPH